ncbi:TetR/AcrR family transcriptional regulator [Streptomyces sp. NRRL S-920]|uniref:TetR/AcrR family transcriptional regulator n=1 Tax=Streptomyces sp. NRRL S-920 TaxID=1463921 RepID=UPI0004CB19D8|nr:TetR-like C-terminal domain-containing protein [Streptomyces sp. NRRL S-920]
MDTPPQPTRRARLRASTLREIKTIASRFLAEGGAGTLSLRAVAREMGMTPAALYTYYDTRDDLLAALAADAYSALAEALEQARGTLPPEDTAGRLVAHGLAYREWALAHPHEFRLLYGEAPAGHPASPSVQAAAQAEHRLCLGLLGLVAAAWPLADALEDAEDYSWEDFDAGFVPPARTAHPELPPSALAVTLRVWGRMHGMVALEVAGLLGPRARDTARLYRDDLRDLARSLGLPPAHPSPAARA